MLKHEGVMVVRLLAFQDEEECSIVVQGYHSLRYTLKELNKVEDGMIYERAPLPEQVMEIYCIIGKDDAVEEITASIRTVQQLLFHKTLNKDAFNSSEYIRQKLKEFEMDWDMQGYIAWMIAEHSFCNHQIYMLQEFGMFHKENLVRAGCFGLGNAYEDDRKSVMQEAVSVWLRQEQPRIHGKQIVINSFLLNDLCGRKILAVLPDEYGNFFLLTEGGKKVYIGDSSNAYTGACIGMNDIGMFSINDVDQICNNPIYTYGIDFFPLDSYLEWQKVLFFIMAVMPVEWNIEKVQNVYESFLEFMKMNICDYTENIPEMISKEKGYLANIHTIDTMRGYLRGKEEVVISKDWLHLLKHRVVYLDKLYCLIEQQYKKERQQLMETKLFDLHEFRQLIDSMQTGTAFEKGIAGEETATYILSRIPGLKVEGTRIRTERQEIDICCSNVSTDRELWELGAVIICECKNWKRKADVSVIRNLAHIANGKGVTTVVLFSRNHITEYAFREVYEQARCGVYILAVSNEDIMKLERKEDCRNMLIHKYNKLHQMLEQEAGLLG